MGTLTQTEKRKVRKPLLWIGMASIMMTFAGLTSGYIVSRSSLLTENAWLQFSLPSAFTWATIMIVLSSVTMIWAKSAAAKNETKNVSIALLLTLLLGLAFVGFQLFGARQLMDSGLYFSGSNTASSWVYAIAGIHWFHVISGIIVLIVTFLRALSGAYTAEDHHGLDISAIYWHFLDALWIFLFLFLVFIR